MVSELNCFSLSLGMRCSHLLLEFGSEQLPLSLGFELNCLSPSLGVWMRLFELNCMFPSLGSDEFWSRMDSIDWIHHSSIGWTHRPSISWLGSATYHSSPRWTYKVWWICCIVLELCADLGLGEFSVIVDFVHAARWSVWRRGKLLTTVLKSSFDNPDLLSSIRRFLGGFRIDLSYPN
jgi:hypothetical protein